MSTASDELRERFVTLLGEAQAKLKTIDRSTDPELYDDFKKHVEDGEKILRSITN